MCHCVLCVVPLPASGGDPARWRLASGVSLLSVVGMATHRVTASRRTGCVACRHQPPQCTEERGHWTDVQFLFTFTGLPLRFTSVVSRGVRLEDEVFKFLHLQQKW